MIRSAQLSARSVLLVLEQHSWHCPNTHNVTTNLYTFYLSFSFISFWITTVFLEYEDTLSEIRYNNMAHVLIFSTGSTRRHSRITGVKLQASHLWMFMDDVPNRSLLVRPCVVTLKSNHECCHEPADNQVCKRSATEPWDCNPETRRCPVICF